MEYVKERRGGLIYTGTLYIREHGTAAREGENPLKPLKPLKTTKKSTTKFNTKYTTRTYKKPRHPKVTRAGKISDVEALAV